MAKKKRCALLESYCERHKISLAELADRLGIAESTARSWVNGTRSITPDRAVEIERRIGIQRESLLPDIFVKRAA